MDSFVGLLMSVNSGCEVCDDFWFRFPKKQPYQLAVNSKMYISLYRCSICNKFWLESQKSAQIIGRKEAQELFPNFDLSI